MKFTQISDATGSDAFTHAVISVMILSSDPSTLKGNGYINEIGFNQNALKFLTVL
jgi:hypothetical protein